jgi:tight adherence protein B
MRATGVETAWAAVLCAVAVLLAARGGRAARSRVREVFGGSGRAAREVAARWRGLLGRRAGVEALCVPAGVVLALTTRSVLPLLAGLAAVPLAGRALRRRAARAAAERGAAAVGGLCTALAGDLRAGRPPHTALGDTVEASGWPANPDLAPAARLLLSAARFGGDVPQALRRAADASEGTRGLAAVAACWQVAVDGGAGLAAALDRVAAALRAEADRRDDLRAQLAGPRSTAVLLALLPLFGVTLGAGLGAHPATILLHTPTGLACLLAGTALEWAGLAWTSRIIRTAESGGGAREGGTDRGAGGLAGVGAGKAWGPGRLPGERLGWAGLGRGGAGGAGDAGGAGRPARIVRGEVVRDRRPGGGGGPRRPMAGDAGPGAGRSPGGPVGGAWAGPRGAAGAVEGAVVRGGLPEIPAGRRAGGGGLSGREGQGAAGVAVVMGGGTVHSLGTTGLVLLVAGGALAAGAGRVRERGRVRRLEVALGGGRGRPRGAGRLRRAAEGLARGRAPVVAAGAGVGLGVAALVGGWLGAGLGLAAGLGFGRWLAGRRRAAEAAPVMPEGDPARLPLCADLMAACLAAGATPGEAAGAVGACLGGPLGAALIRARAELRLGGDPVECWLRFGDRPAARAMGQCLARASTTGSAPVAEMSRLAADLRAAHGRTALAAARRAAVLATAPLGLCFLPAFLLVGVAPVVIGLAGRVLGGR